MKRAVWATFFHKLSCDKFPQHGLCPTGPVSWCKYNRSKALNEPCPSHKPLPPTIMELIKPVYKDLCDPALFRKCLHGKPQNQNESFNNMIWTKIPKNVFVGLKTLRLGVLDAVICFNDGCLGKVKVLQKRFGKAGPNTAVGLKAIDFKRVQDAERTIQAYEQPAKEFKKNLKRKIIDVEDNPDDPDYGYGAH